MHDERRLAHLIKTAALRPIRRAQRQGQGASCPKALSDVDQTVRVAASYPRDRSRCNDGVVPFRICFVCTGNICRSPMAEVVLRHQAGLFGMGALLAIDSAGTAADVGYGMDRRARDTLSRRGYDPGTHLGRQFEPAWLDERDLVVALDTVHLQWLNNHAPKGSFTARVQLLMSFAGEWVQSGNPLGVPDPYFGDEQDFESCLDLVEIGCEALLSELSVELAAP